MCGTLAPPVNASTKKHARVDQLLSIGPPEPTPEGGRSRSKGDTGIDSSRGPEAVDKAYGQFGGAAIRWLWCLTLGLGLMGSYVLCDLEPDSNAIRVGREGSSLAPPSTNSATTRHGEGAALSARWLT
jgi:hypothetical protein